MFSIRPICKCRCWIVVFDGVLYRRRFVGEMDSFNALKVVFVGLPGDLRSAKGLRVVDAAIAIVIFSVAALWLVCGALTGKGGVAADVNACASF